MGINDTSFNADLLDYRDLPVKIPPRQFNLRQALFGKTIKKLGAYATRGDSSVSNFLAKEIDLSYLRPKNHIRNHAKNMALSSSKAKKQKTLSSLSEIRKSMKLDNQILASATTVFPFTLFRDDITVDRNKVTITKRQFFFVSEVVSIRIEDILNVKISVGPFFGSINISVRILNSEDHHDVSYLWRNDAINLKHIIQGYVIARHNKVDFSDLKKSEMIEVLNQLGHDTG